MAPKKLYPGFIHQDEIPFASTSVGLLQIGDRLVIKLRIYAREDNPQVEFPGQTVQECFVVDKNQAIMTFSEIECRTFLEAKNLKIDSMEGGWVIELFSGQGSPPAIE